MTAVDRWYLASYTSCIGEPDCDFTDLDDGFVYHAGWCPLYDPDRSGVHSVIVPPETQP